MNPGVWMCAQPTKAMVVIFLGWGTIPNRGTRYGSRRGGSHSVTRERALAERDERLRRVREQAAEWRARAEASRTAAQQAIAARRAAARVAMAHATRLQRAVVDAFAVRVAAQRENAAHNVERINRQRARA